MSDTPITPTAGALTLAGVALTLVAATATIRTPTIGAVTLASSAGSVVVQQQTPDVPGTVNLLNSDSKTGIVKRWPGGSGLLSAWGTWGGATVTLNFAAADGTMLAVGTATTLTANGLGAFSLPPGYIQAAISSASGTTSLSAAAQVVPTSIA